MEAAWQLVATDFSCTEAGPVGRDGSDCLLTDQRFTLKSCDPVLNAWASGFSCDKCCDRLVRLMRPVHGSSEADEMPRGKRSADSAMVVLSAGVVSGRGQRAGGRMVLVKFRAPGGEGLVYAA